MLVTAIVKGNNLIIPNIDIDLLPQQPDEFGMVDMELSFSQQTASFSKEHLQNSDTKNSYLAKKIEKTTTSENSLSDPKNDQHIHPAVAKYGGVLAKYTNKKLSDEQMMQGVAKHFMALNKDEI